MMRYYNKQIYQKLVRHRRAPRHECPEVGRDLQIRQREEVERGDEKNLPCPLNPLLFSADLLGFVYLD